MTLSLTPRERQKLKGQAHSLEPLVHIGQSGATDRVIAEVDRALAAHQLIKVKIEADRDARDAIADEISEKTGAAAVQQVGKVLILWRPKDHEGEDADG